MKENKGARRSKKDRRPTARHANDPEHSQCGTQTWNGVRIRHPHRGGRCGAGWCRQVDDLSALARCMVHCRRRRVRRCHSDLASPELRNRPRKFSGVYAPRCTLFPRSPRRDPPAADRGGRRWTRACDGPLPSTGYPPGARLPGRSSAEASPPANSAPVSTRIPCLMLFTAPSTTGFCFRTMAIPSVSRMRILMP